MEEPKVIIREGTIAEALEMELATFGSQSDKQGYLDKKAKIMVVSYNGQVVSFLATYLRDGRIYIWLCGTKDIIVDSVPMRRQGILAQMLKLVLPTYEEEGVFVKTYPQFFKNMYSWITKRGFIYEGDEPDNRHPERGSFARFGTTKKDLLNKL